MLPFGVKCSCFSCDRYFVIDSIITLVVVAVCVPVFITVSAARVYTGILLGLAVIFFFKLWRFLPSHRRWVEHSAERKAAKLAVEWRAMRPSSQVLYTPTAMTGIVELPAANAMTTAGAAMGGGSHTPVAYLSRTPYNSPPVGSPCSPPVMLTAPPPLPPTPFLSRQPFHADYGGHTDGAVWGGDHPQPSSPWYPAPPAMFNVAHGEDAHRSLSPAPSPRPTRPPQLVTAVSEDAQRSYTPAEESVWCSQTSRSAQATPPLRVPRLCGTPPPVNSSANGYAEPMRRSMSPLGASYALSGPSLPASYRPSSAAPRGSQYLRGHSPYAAAHSVEGRRSGHRRRHSSHGSRRRATSQSSASSYSVGSSASSGARSAVWEDAPYAVRSQHPLPPVSSNLYG